VVQFESGTAADGNEKQKKRHTAATVTILMAHCDQTNAFTVDEEYMHYFVITLVIRPTDKFT
jgi:hypothetical protein